jgi:DNA-binding transcriptional LysR family regulator
MAARAGFAPALPQKICCKNRRRRWQDGTMTWLLPPLNALRAFEVAARHLSFKLAAHELHVTAGAVSQQVKLLEERLGLRLFDRLHRQLILTPAGQRYLPGVRAAFRQLAEATQTLEPEGMIKMVTLGIHGRFDLARLDAARFRAAHPMIGLRIVQPAGLRELDAGKCDLLIDRGLGHHPRCRCDRLDGARTAVGDFLIAPEGTADCPEVERLRDWLLTGLRTGTVTGTGTGAAALADAS